MAFTFVGVGVLGLTPDVLTLSKTRSKLFGCHRSSFGCTRAARLFAKGRKMSVSEKPKFYGQELRDAHALAIGKIVMAWNEYHETLGEIYAEICGRDKWSASLDD